MKPQRGLGPVIVLVLAGCGAEVTTAPPNHTTSPPSAAAPASSVSTSPDASRSATASPPISCDDRATSALVAYGDADDLWLYDVATDTSRQLTHDGEGQSEWLPAFAGAGCLVYAKDGPAIELLDLIPGGGSRTLVAEVGTITHLAVSPDGTTLLYLHIDFDVDSTYRLKRVELGGGEPVVMHTFSPNLGRGGSSEDEVSIAWSPDGSSILVANTHEFSREFENGAIYIFDATAGGIVAKWKGTHPRWSPDGETVYFRGFANQDDQGWFAMRLRTMNRTKVGFRPGTNNLVVSPDGRYVAYDTSSIGDIPMGVVVTGKPPTVYLYDVRRAREELVLRGGIQPLWIAADRLVATNVSQGAPNPNTFGAPWWDPLGTVASISLDGASQSIAMTSTIFDAAVSLPN